MATQKTVLLIDDDKDDLELLHGALRSVAADYSIIEAHNGLDGLAKLDKLVETKRIPCLVVLDLNMPGMDGKQTFIAIKHNKRFSQIPIVIFSTSTNHIEKSFFEKHNTAYLVKPFNFAELAKTAKGMISICEDKPASA